jgi:hypothetical protein
MRCTTLKLRGGPVSEQTRSGSAAAESRSAAPVRGGQPVVGPPRNDGIRAYFRNSLYDGGVSRVVGLVVAWLAFGLIRFVMPVPDGMTPAGKATLAVVVWACVMWVFEAVPVGVTGLAIPMMLVMAGVFTDPAKALAGFTQQEIFLALSAFILAAAMHLTGLDRKLAGGLLSKLRIKTATGACVGMSITNTLLAFVMSGVKLCR